MRTAADGSLPDAVHLLPTPEAKLADAGPDYARATRPGAGGDDLTTAVHRQLLPTAVAADGERQSHAYARGNPTLLGATAQLLPTPVSTDANGARSRTTTTPEGSAREVGTTLGDVVHDERTQGAAAWGPYAAAITRWETTTGRPAPAPTEPGTKGQPRLAPRFVEWLMGLPPGWVTDVPATWVVEDLFGTIDPGATRGEQLKMLGNGVVPQQAALALAHLDVAAVLTRHPPRGAP